MEFVPVAKNHFIHACKLFKDGYHTLFNKKKGKSVRHQKGDTEGAEILKRGVSCVVYDKSIWEDSEAVPALASIAKLNSKIDAGEDEMHAFGRIDELYSLMSKQTQWQSMAKDDGIPVSAVVEALDKHSGLGHYVLKDWECLISLRAGLTKAHAEILECASLTLSPGKSG